MTDAPKIDTQAPERVWISPEEPGTNDAQVWDEDAAGLFPEYLRRDLADARAAAAAQAMREAAAKALQDVADNWDCGHNESRLCDCARDAEQWGFAADEVRHIKAPTDASDALDRLIAERVREAVEAEREACAQIIDGNMLCEADGSREVLMPRSNPGNKVGMAYAAAIRERGSKEGRDG